MEQTKLYSMHSANCLLGCLFNNPKLLLNGKFNLEGEDFSPCKFHRILFWCIRNLVSKGVTEIDEVTVDSFLQGHEEYLEICNDNNFLEVIPNLKEISLEGSIEYYYDVVKKFGLLRYYKENGHDIKEFFDEGKDYEKQLGVLEKYKIEDIIGFYKGVNATAEKRFNDKIKLKEMKAGETFQEVKERFKIEPYFGANLQSPYQTTLYRGWCKGHLLLRSAPSGFGKALSNETRIVTPNGLTPIGKIKVGDKIIGENGKEYNVEGVFPQGKKQVYEVEFSNGEVIECCNEHLWTFQTKSQRGEKSKKWNTKTLQEIIDNYPISTQRKESKEWNIYMPEVLPFDFTKKDFAIPPYLLGVVLGDGGTYKKNRLTISNTEQDIIDKISKELLEINGELIKINNTACEYRVRTKNKQEKPWHKYFEETGLFGCDSSTKFIPEKYKYGSIEQRLELLQGLIDTDGYNLGTLYNYYSVSSQLIKDVKYLCESLGCTAKLSVKKDPKFSYKNEIRTGKDCYILTIKTSKILSKIHSSEKHEYKWKRGQSCARLTIRDIRKTNSYKEMTCISVSNPSKLFVLEGGIPTHNTILAVGDLCSVCATEYWDDKQEKFILNPNCEHEGGLYINTEMDLDTEMQPMFIAWISGIPRSTIMDGDYTEEEEKRLDYANKVLLDSNIYLVDDPKFTLFSLENTIQENAINRGVGYVVIDYFQDNGIIGKEMSKTHSIIARDTIILNLADESKKWARDYNVAILAMTQLNGNEKINEIIDESCLAGGRAVKNKIDAGSIIMFPRKKELGQTEGLKEKRGFGIKIEPNAVIHNYKVRFGKYGTNIKLLQNIDLGTGRITDLYATDVFNKPINIEITKKE